MAGRIYWKAKAQTLFAALILAMISLPIIFDVRLVSSYADNLLFSDAMSFLLVYGALIVAVDFIMFLGTWGHNTNNTLYNGSANEGFYSRKSSSPNRLKAAKYFALCGFAALPVALAHTVYCDQITGDRCLVDGFDTVADFGWWLTLASFTAVFTVLFRAGWSLYQLSLKFFDPDARLNTRIFGARD